MNVEVKTITSGDIARCPKLSLLPSHYRPDGTCRCNEREAALAERVAARAAWAEACKRVRAAVEWLART